MMKYTNLINLGIEKKYISISPDNLKITYIEQNKSYKFSDPEEKIRAEYYIELIEKYKYNPNKIDFEVEIPKRIPCDFADIVVFKDNEHKKPYIVIECKKSNISDSEFNQSIEQAFGNANSVSAPFVGIISGKTRRFFDNEKFGSLERNKNIIADIPINYGKLQDFRYKKQDKDWDIKPVEKGELIKVIEKCHNTLWDGGKLAPIDAFDELCKIIFIKIRDEQKARKNGEAYDFQLKTYESAKAVQERILELYIEAKKLDSKIFTDTINIPEEKIVSIVSHLQGINLSKTDLDTKGVAFERFMEDFFKGKQGQYFTPREIVNFIIQITTINENSKVLDIACGSGGFLLYALDYIRNLADQYYEKNTVEHYKFWHNFASNNLFGIEVNERIARVAKMNMILHDDGHTNVICMDALENLNTIQKINQEFKKEYFDLIITNPPFGAEVKLEEKAYLETYFFGKDKNSKKRKSQKTEILFIERCWEFLKDSTGYLAIILPDGILTNTTLSYVREFIVDKFEIEALISIPQVTFEHYGAGLKSTIMLLRKKAAKEKCKNYKIFCACINNVGYDSTGRADKNDLPEVAKKFQQYKRGIIFNNDNLTFIKNIEEFKHNRLDPYYHSPIFDKILNEIKNSKIQIYKLKELCKTIYINNKKSIGIFNGSTPAKSDYSENCSDTKIIKVASLKNGSVDFNLIEYVKEEAVTNKIVEDNDILILSSAHQAEYLGKNPCIVKIPENLKNEKIMFVGELINIRLNTDIVNPYYILQLFNTYNYFKLINREKRGQTSHLYPSDMMELLIPIPNKKIQDANANEYIKNYVLYQNLISKANNVLEKTYRSFENTFLGKL